MPRISEYFLRNWANGQGITLGMAQNSARLVPHLHVEHTEGIVADHAVAIAKKQPAPVRSFGMNWSEISPSWVCIRPNSSIAWHLGSV